MSRRLLTVLLVPAALGAAVPATAGSQVLVRAPEHALPRVVADPSGLAVETARGPVRLAPVPGTRVESIVALGDGWWVAGSRPDGDGRELVLLAERGRGVEELPPPPARAANRSRPVPVVSRGAIEGLLWLEGDEETRHAVLWSAWNGGGFDPPSVVSPPGPGSQLALAAAALDDGRVLAVWAGFDGEDDEIWASLLGRQGWSAPTRVGEANQVPDILPTVTPTPGGGARVAWCRFDGSEYRVATARLDGDRFVDAPVPGPPGSLYPSFERSGEETLLLWFDARTDRWALGTVSADGGLAPRATTPGRSSERPAITGSGETLRFRFADGELPPDAD